jgi:hypothetical protein
MLDAGSRAETSIAPRTLHPASPILLLDFAGYAADTSRIDPARALTVFSQRCGECGP